MITLCYIKLDNALCNYRESTQTSSSLDNGFVHGPLSLHLATEDAPTCNKLEIQYGVVEYNQYKENRKFNLGDYSA